MMPIIKNEAIYSIEIIGNARVYNTILNRWYTTSCKVTLKQNMPTQEWIVTKVILLEESDDNK